MFLFPSVLHLGFRQCLGFSHGYFIAGSTLFRRVSISAISEY